MGLKTKKYLFKPHNNIIKNNNNSLTSETYDYFRYRCINIQVPSTDQVFRKLSEDRDILKSILKTEYNGKKSSGCTLEGTNRKKAKKSGFRARMATKKGRKVIACRRAKGRLLCCYSHNGSNKN